MPGVLILSMVEDGGLQESTGELATVARHVAGEAERVVAVVLGSRLDEASVAAARWFDEVIAVDDLTLAVPDGDLYAEVVAPIVGQERPDLVLLSHTNFAMDVAPRLSVMLERPLMTDCLSLDVADGRLTGIRTMYGGKVQARMDASMAPNGCLATVRPGSSTASEAPVASGVIRRLSLPGGIAPRRRFVRTVRPNAEGVDIRQAEILVAVGRGIEDSENLGIIEDLAKALGGEIACSRPVVDNNWLPRARQVGTSGMTVRPRVYVAVGISGSFQHMGGVKGSPFIVAINKDPRAPIFTEANVGIVGDLFDIVPVLTEKIQAAKG